MATNITITEQAAAAMRRRAHSAGTAGAAVSGAAVKAAKAVKVVKAADRATSPRRLPGWLWFVALWCGGVGAAMGLGFAFKVLMNLTLFAVK
ncbi:DUF2474 domain-containing protein [Paraburkholderia kururiensis]|uniref:hypothetical protein n=1 Tax=Paraburkholderia kururiensis TaxID=984307 RepID=UPI0039A6C0DE